MTRAAVLLALLTACTFRSHAVAQTGDDAAPTGDAPPSSDAALVDGRMIDAALPPPPVDAPPPPPAFCNRNDPTLVACYEFENTTTDGSPNGLDATNTSVTYVAGKVGNAAHDTATTAMNVSENAALDVSALTIEAWIKAPIPATGRAGIVDNNGQWGFFLQPNGALQGVGLTSTANVPANTWTHVALTYDGTTRHYVNGVEVGSMAGTTIAVNGGTTGISIAADNPPGSGSPLNGDIDQLRIFSVARTAQQIAADATP